ncbi:MAG: hypothetical protein ACRDOD_09510 [Streptosporangiaceae bacterium]
MDVWWWVPIDLAAWCRASVVIALCIGPVLRRSAQVRESLDQQFAETTYEHDKPVPAARRASDPAIVRQR